MISEAGGGKKQKSQTIVLHQLSHKPLTLWMSFMSVILTNRAIKAVLNQSQMQKPAAGADGFTVFTSQVWFVERKSLQTTTVRRHKATARGCFHPPRCSCGCRPASTSQGGGSCLPPSSRINLARVLFVVKGKNSRAVYLNKAALFLLQRSH